MNPLLRNTIKRTVAAGSFASILSAMALTVLGRRETGSAAAPINAVSHWFWDREALRRNGIDARHTLVGYVTHHGAALFWAGLYAWAIHGRPKLLEPAAVVAGSVATSAVACFVDFNMTPERLTPGYEHRLSRGALTGVYAAFAVGLALGTLLVKPAESAASDQD